MTGERGDLSASIAAVLLDREARDPVLDADPLFGMLREPVIKAMHMMKALEFEGPPGAEEMQLERMYYAGQNVRRRETSGVGFNLF